MEANKAGARNRITDDKLIVSTEDAPASMFEAGALLTSTCRVKGSIFNQIILNVNHLLKTIGDFEFIVHNLDENKSIRTITTIEEKSLRFASALTLSGFNKGDVVCMMLGPGNTEVFYSAFAAWGLGGIVFFGDVRAGTKALALQLSTIGCKYVIISESSSDFCQQVSQISDERLNIIRQTETNEFYLSRDGGDFELLLVDEKNVKLPDVDGDEDVAVIAFTSGTTGIPKPLMHTHSSAWNIFSEALNHHFGSRSIGLTTIKCDTFVGMTFFITNLVQSQSTLVIGLDEEVYEDNIFSAIDKYRPTSISLYGNHFVRLAEAQQLMEFSNKGLLSSIRSINTMGSAVPSECENRLRHFCPNLKMVVCCFGTNESGCLTSATTSKHLGFLVPNTEIKVVSLDDPSKRLGPGEVGELCVRKPFMMKGYYNRPEETEKYFDDENFGHVGDVVRYDDEGKIYFVERIKEMIKFNDFRVWPTIVEAELQKHPAVRECLVYGKPNPRTMELPAALVVLKEGYTEDVESDIQEFMKGQVQDCNLIRGGITFTKKLPRNTMGKLMRREARAMALEATNN